MDNATAFTQSIQGTPPAAEAKAPMREQREAAAQATEDALDKAIESVLDDGDDGDEGSGRAPKTPKRVARAVKGGTDDEEGNPDLDGDEDEDDEGELEELPDEDDDLEDEADEGARAEDDDEEEPEAEEADEDDDEALSRAWDKLRAAKVPLSVLKTTAREKLIAWADSMDGDEKGAGASRSGKGGSEAGRAGTSSQTEADASSLDWTPLRETLADELGLDPERAERAFSPLVQAIEKAVAAKFEKRLEKAEALSRSMLEARGREKIDANVRRLSKAYPRLATNPRLVEQLKAKAVTLAKSGDYRDADTVFDEAASIVLGPKKREVILAQKRRNGLSASPERLGGRRNGDSQNVDGWFEEQMGLVEAGKVARALRNPPPKVRGQLRF